MTRVVVTGTGRSGTKWCATVLRLGGILCGHEQVFTTGQFDGMTEQEWGPFEADSSLAAVPFLDRHPQARKVLVVREPLAFAGSILAVGPLLCGSQPRALADHLARRHPWVLDAPTEAGAALRWWAVWNGQGASHADVTLRLEGLTPDVLYDACGVVPRWPTFPFDRPVNAGAADKTAVTWGGCGDPDAVDAALPLAARFGYGDGDGR